MGPLGVGGTLLRRPKKQTNRPASFQTTKSTTIDRIASNQLDSKLFVGCKMQFEAITTSDSRVDGDKRVRLPSTTKPPTEKARSTEADVAGM